VRVNVRTQSPPDVTVIVTPVALSTSAVQEPLVTATACAGDTIMVDGIARTEADKTAKIPENRAMRLNIKVDLITSGPGDCL
jgi:hypothetical protein